jgi:hypothetical protein
LADYLRESIVDGVGRNLNGYVKLEDSSSSLLASRHLKYVSDSPCWNLTKSIKANHYNLFQKLGNPELIVMRGLALELIFGEGVRNGEIHSRDLSSLSDIVSKDLFGKGLYSNNSSICMLCKIIECNDSEVIKDIAAERNLQRISEDLYFGGGNILSELIDDIELDLNASIIVASHDALNSYPSSGIIFSLLLVSFMMSELFNIWQTTKEAIFHLGVSQYEMSILFENQLKREDIIKYGFMFRKDLILRLSAFRQQIITSLLTKPSGIEEMISYNLYGSTEFSRLYEIENNLGTFIDELISTLSILDEDSPILENIERLRNSKPKDQIMKLMRALREVLLEFAKSFDEEIAQVQTNTRIKIAVRGILISTLALLGSLFFNIIEILPQDMMMQLIQYFMMFILGITSVGIFAVIMNKVLFDS